MKVFVTLSALFAVAIARGYNQPQSSNYNQAATYQQQQQPAHYQAAAAASSHYSAGTEQQKPPIPIIRSESKHNEDGSYEYSYETGNGISAGEQGYVKNAGQKDNEIQVAQGYFQYTGDDGIPISLKYVADENGFQPTGDHLPTPPPLPQEIIDALAKIAADPRHNDGDDGQYHGETAASSGHYKAVAQPQQYHQQPQQQQYHQQPQNHYNNKY